MLLRCPLEGDRLPRNNTEVIYDVAINCCVISPLITIRSESGIDSRSNERLEMLSAYGVIRESYLLFRRETTNNGIVFSKEHLLSLTHSRVAINQPFESHGMYWRL